MTYSGQRTLKTDRSDGRLILHMTSTAYNLKTSHQSVWTDKIFWVEGERKGNFNPKSNCAVLKTTKKKKGLPLRVDSCLIEHVNVQDWRRLNKNSLFGRVASWNPVLSRNIMKALLRFTKVHLKKSQDFQNKVLWTCETKVEMFHLNAQHHV